MKKDQRKSLKHQIRRVRRAIEAKERSSFKPENDPSIRPATEELERVYNASALMFPNLDRPRPRIVIQTRGRKKHALGWFAPNRWKDNRAADRPPIHEITLAAEELSRSPLENMATLLHEMTHLDCYYGGVRDVGKDGRYHNRKFKAAAEAIGFIVEKDQRLGWCRTKPGPELAKLIFGLNVKDEAFAIFRVAEPERPKQPKKMKKWVCACPHIVRCTFQLKSHCDECGEPFEWGENEPNPWVKESEAAASQEGENYSDAASRR